MPKRKITLEEAFAVFEQHGLQVEVKGVQPEVDDDGNKSNIGDFLDDDVTKMDITHYPPIPKQVSEKKVKITLYAQHSIGCGGYMVIGDDGKPHPQHQGVESYGPGICTVSVELAAHLLHQDELARNADAHFLDRTFRSYVVVPRRTANGVVNTALCVSDDGGFDMFNVINNMSDGNVHIIG